MLRLRAQIVVDIAADDYVQAAEHQRLLEEFLGELRRKYPDAKLSMRERRERKVEPLHEARPFAKGVARRS